MTYFPEQGARRASLSFMPVVNTIMSTCRVRRVFTLLTESAIDVSLPAGHINRAVMLSVHGWHTCVEFENGVFVLLGQFDKLLGRRLISILTPQHLRGEPIEVASTADYSSHRLTE